MKGVHLTKLKRGKRKSSLEAYCDGTLCGMQQVFKNNWVGDVVVLGSNCIFIYRMLHNYSAFLSMLLVHHSRHPRPHSRVPLLWSMSGVNNIANTADNRQYVCRCLMDLIDNFSSNASAIGILPGLCGISLGFNIDPNADCSL